MSILTFGPHRAFLVAQQSGVLHAKHMIPSQPDTFSTSAVHAGQTIACLFLSMVWRRRQIKIQISLNRISNRLSLTSIISFDMVSSRLLRTSGHTSSVCDWEQTTHQVTKQIGQRNFLACPSKKQAPSQSAVLHWNVSLAFALMACLKPNIKNRFQSAAVRSDWISRCSNTPSHGVSPSRYGHCTVLLSEALI